MADPDSYLVLLGFDRSCFATSILRPLDIIIDTTIMDLLRRERENGLYVGLKGNSLGK